MVFKRTNEGDITKQTNAKIAVYTCPIDITTTETKVLINLCNQKNSWFYLILYLFILGNSFN
jgi:hypothetical protein